MFLFKNLIMEESGDFEGALKDLEENGDKIVDKKSLLESKGKIYTQIKIDEITNLGAVKIRLRSLFAALKQKREE